MAIELLKREIKELKELIETKEKMLEDLVRFEHELPNIYTNGLSCNEVTRYSRQLIIDEFNLDGQIALKNGSVLIVGAGGLGCPASLYLAAAGVGEITIVDYDEVELTNLHRQILHSENDIGVTKVTSVQIKLKKMNSRIKIIPLHMQIDSKNIETLMRENKYDVVVDGSDNVATRYLLNDVCVINDIPLVSGSALQMEGQLTVYHYKEGPCYRCLYPIPPPPTAVTSCGDGGVLGPVPGTIGVLQALEAIKIISKLGDVLSQRMLLFDGSSSTFRNVKLRPRNSKCEVCGDNPTITKLIDYVQFCGAQPHDKVIDIDIIKSENCIDVKNFSLKYRSENIICLDVRPEKEFKMCALPKTMNFPYLDIIQEKKSEEIEKCLKETAPNCNVYVLCRRGNDSQRAITHLTRRFNGLPIRFINVIGGLNAYSNHVDKQFPAY